MDLNRLRVLAGLEDYIEQKPVLSINEEMQEHHLVFECPKCKHGWSLDAKVNRDDECEKCGTVSAPKSDKTSKLKEDVNTPTYFVYGRCERKSARIPATNMLEAIQTFANSKVEKISGDPEMSSQDSPVKFMSESGDGCEYVSYQITNESFNLDDAHTIMESMVDAKKLSNQKHGDNPAKESNHDSDIPKVTFMDKTPPANALVMTQVEFNDDTLEFNKAKMGVDDEESDKIKVPADVMKHLNKRIKELKASIETYDEKGYNDKSVRSTAIDCLEKIKAHLEAGNKEQYKQAQIYYGTLMSPIFDMFPTQLINFLHSDKDTKKEII